MTPERRRRDVWQSAFARGLPRATPRSRGKFLPRTRSKVSKNHETIFYRGHAEKLQDLPVAVPTMDRKSSDGLKEGNDPSFLDQNCNWNVCEFRLNLGVLLTVVVVDEEKKKKKALKRKKSAGILASLYRALNSKARIVN